MECPICFEALTHVYKMRGCCHEMCRSCSRKLKCQPESLHFAFQAIYVVEEAPQIQLKCPLCRAVEPVLSIDLLKKQYPEAYLEWMETELHRDEWDNSFAYTYDYAPFAVARRATKIPKHLNNRKAPKRWQGRKM